MADRVIAVPLSGGGPATYTLRDAEAFTLRGVTWRQNVSVPVSASGPAVPALLAYSPEGLLIARVSAPAVIEAAPTLPTFHGAFDQDAPKFIFQFEVTTVDNDNPYIDNPGFEIVVAAGSPSFVGVIDILTLTAGTGVNFGSNFPPPNLFGPGVTALIFNAPGHYAFPINPDPAGMLLAFTYTFPAGHVTGTISIAAP